MGGAFVDWRGRVVVVLGYVGGEVSFCLFFLSMFVVFVIRSS